MIRDSKIQFADQESIKSFQSERLREELKYIYENSKFYRRLLDSNSISIEDIGGVDDLVKLPVTTKEDLQRYNDEFIAIDKSEIIDIVTTSGTLGDPVTFVLSEDDLQRLAYNEALSFTTAGCTKDDTIQLMTTIDKRFMAGLAYFMGARELQCGVIRVGNGIPELQWDTIRRVNPSACIVVPSFLTKLSEFAKASNIDHHNSSIKRAICIGEALRNPNGELNALGQKITDEWSEVELFSTYASTEMQSSFTECEYHAGCHTPSNLIIVELLDDNNLPVPNGEAGEVTITTIGVKGMPLLRFKTGDICVGDNSTCKCGRSTLRLSSVIGRKGQMIKYKGTTLYPSAIFMDDPIQ
ncbi:MAG: AMP-binding protein, partial [Rikenellaceae bacterium]